MNNAVSVVNGESYPDCNELEAKLNSIIKNSNNVIPHVKLFVKSCNIDGAVLTSVLLDYISGTDNNDDFKCSGFGIVSGDIREINYQIQCKTLGKDFVVEYYEIFKLRDKVVAVVLFSFFDSIVKDERDHEDFFKFLDSILSDASSTMKS